MEPIDDALDERLRTVARPDPARVQRITASALAGPTRPRPVVPRLLAVALCCAVIIAFIALWRWPHPTPSAGSAAVQGLVGVVLVRAPDGTSAIFSAARPAGPELAPGTGFVMSEGDR